MRVEISVAVHCERGLPRLLRCAAVCSQTPTGDAMALGFQISGPHHEYCFAFPPKYIGKASISAALLVRGVDADEVLSVFCSH